MSDEKLQEIVSEYADLAKDKNIDVATLMVNALQQEDANMINSKTKRWAYLISLGVPPFGLLFAVYFYFSDKSDGKSAALICLLLTIFTIVISVISLKMIFSGSGASVEQIQQIKPADIYQLTQ